ncbi:MAG: tetratricopeptide repeat protein [Bacteroidetes bacterium]|nr:tetratricopeptide repeat protein [Bacteroidota bacterium]
MKKYISAFVLLFTFSLVLITLPSCAALGLSTAEQAPSTDTTSQSTEISQTESTPTDTSPTQVDEPVDEGMDTVYTDIPEPETEVVNVVSADTLIELQPEIPTQDVIDFNTDALQRENESLREENELLKARVSNLEKDLNVIEGGRSISKKEPIRGFEISTPISSEIITEVNAEISKIAPITRSSSGSGKSSNEELSAYKNSIEILKQGNYAAAGEQLQSLLSGGLKDDLADNAYYWIGEAAFGQKKYDEALNNFKQVSNYKVSEKKDDAQYMIARCYERLGKNQQAVKEYRKLIDVYPTSEFVKRSQARIK